MLRLFYTISISFFILYIYMNPEQSPHEQLIATGSDVNYYDDRDSIISLAVKTNNRELIDMLLNHGAKHTNGQLNGGVDGPPKVDRMKKVKGRRRLRQIVHTNVECKSNVECNDDEVCYENNCVDPRKHFQIPEIQKTIGQFLTAEDADNARQSLTFGVAHKGLVKGEKAKEAIIIKLRKGEYGDDSEIVRGILEDHTNNVGYSSAITWAAENGHAALVELLLQDDRVDPTAKDNIAFRRAAASGHVSVVELLLQDDRVDPTAKDNIAFQFAASNGHLQVVERLLRDPRVDPTVQNNYPFRRAAASGHVSVVELLLQDPRVDPSSLDNDAFRYAAVGGQITVIKRLLRDPRVDPSANDNFAIRFAAQHGHLAVVERLLQDDRVDPTVNDNAAIRYAAYNGYISVVDQLLRDSRVDPSANDNYAILAAANGHHAVVERLLQDDRVDPSAKDNKAIQIAAYNGYISVVDQLLRDSRVDPSARNNYAIRMAAANGHLAVVERLLQDDRVDPSAKENEAIQQAVQNRHVAVAERLLQNKLVTDMERHYQQPRRVHKFLNKLTKTTTKLEIEDHIETLLMDFNHEYVLSTLFSLQDDAVTPVIAGGKVIDLILLKDQHFQSFDFDIHLYKQNGVVTPNDITSFRSNLKRRLNQKMTMANIITVNNTLRLSTEYPGYLYIEPNPFGFYNHDYPHRLGLKINVSDKLTLQLKSKDGKLRTKQEIIIIVSDIDPLKDYEMPGTNLFDYCSKSFNGLKEILSRYGNRLNKDIPGASNVLGSQILAAQTQIQRMGNHESKIVTLDGPHNSKLNIVDLQQYMCTVFRLIQEYISQYYNNYKRPAKITKNIKRLLFFLEIIYSKDEEFIKRTLHVEAIKQLRPDIIVNSVDITVGFDKTNTVSDTVLRPLNNHLDSLSNEDKQVIDHYSSLGYKTMQESILKNPINPSDGNVPKLSRIINTFPKLTTDVHVIRMVQYYAVRYDDVTPISKMDVGDIYYNPVFMSTTYKPSLYKAPTIFGTSYSYCCIFKIKIPAGTSVALILNKDENELLIDRETIFEITGKKMSYQHMKYKFLQNSPETDTYIPYLTYDMTLLNDGQLTQTSDLHRIVTNITNDQDNDDEKNDDDVNVAVNSDYVNMINQLWERMNKPFSSETLQEIKLQRESTVKDAIVTKLQNGEYSDKDADIIRGILNGKYDLNSTSIDYRYPVYWAASNGHLDVLKWIHDNGVEMAAIVSEAAARGGHLDVLKWIHDNGGELTARAAASAARGGHLDVLKWIHANGGELTAYAAESAAYCGHLEVLKWIRVNGGELTAHAAEFAALKGHLEVLKWIRDNGGELTARVADSAASTGHLDVLKWIRDNGGEFTDYARKRLEEFEQQGGVDEECKQDTDCADDERCYLNQCEKKAAWNKMTDPRKHLNIPEMQRTMGQFMTAEDADNARQSLKFGVAHKGLMKGEKAKEAIVIKLRKGEYNAKHTGYIRRILHDHTKNISIFPSIVWAAKHGYLDIVKYIHEQGGPWDDAAASYAASNGHLDIVKYIHEQNGPWNENASSYATSNGHFDIVKYIHEQGGPMTDEALQMLEQNGGVDDGDDSDVEIIDDENEDVRAPIPGSNERLITTPQEQFFEAIRTGNANDVRELLQNNQVNPAANDNIAIGVAAGGGYMAIVRLLVADRRVDPFANDNNAINVASEQGHEDVAQYLRAIRQARRDQRPGGLVDRMIEPAHQYNDVYELLDAVNSGNISEVNRLLQPEQIDPSDIENVDHVLIRQAARSGNLAILNALLEYGIGSSVTNELMMDIIDTTNNEVISERLRQFHLQENGQIQHVSPEEQPVCELLLTLEGHTSTINSAEFSPDGSKIVTKSEDRTAKVWDAETGGDLRTLHHTGLVTSARFSPDGSKIVTASYDKTTKVWDANIGGDPLLTLEGHTSSVPFAQFSPDGSKIVTASYDRTAKVWDANTGDPLLTLEGHIDDVTSAQFSPDGSKIVMASWEEDTTKVWDANTGVELLTLEGHTSAVNSARFSPDGSKIVTASRDKTAKVWDAETGGDPLLTLQGHTNLLLSAHFSRDGSKIVTSSYDRTAKVWDANIGGDPLLTLEGHTGWVKSARFSRDGSKIVTASWDNTAKVWDAYTGEELHTFIGHTDTVTSAQFSPDGSKIVTASNDKTANVWSCIPVSPEQRLRREEQRLRREEERRRQEEERLKQQRQRTRDRQEQLDANRRRLAQQYRESEEKQPDEPLHSFVEQNRCKNKESWFTTEPHAPNADLVTLYVPGQSDGNCYDRTKLLEWLEVNRVHSRLQNGERANLYRLPMRELTDERSVGHIRDTNHNRYIKETSYKDSGGSTVVNVYPMVDTPQQGGSNVYYDKRVSKQSKSKHRRLQDIQLMNAVRDQRIDEVKKLLKRGGDVNYYDHRGSLISVAVETNNRELIDLLLNSGAKHTSK
jgi:WD40 repeat protein